MFCLSKALNKLDMMKVGSKIHKVLENIIIMNPLILQQMYPEKLSVMELEIQISINFIEKYVQDEFLLLNNQEVR